MLTSTTELEAINQILGGIGETPVSSLANAGVNDVALARQMLTNVSRQVQSREWHWNTDPKVTLTPAILDRYIYLPLNTIKVDSVDVDEGRDVAQRGNRLYDRDNATYEFTKPILVKLVTFLTFDELPEVARAYITLSARRRYQEDQLGSSDLATFHRRDELMAMVDLLHADADNADYNLKNSPYMQGALLR